MTIQDFFNQEPDELFVQTIERDGKEFQIIPIDKVRFMLNEKLVSWGTDNFQVSLPYHYEGEVFVNSSCEIFGECLVEYQDKINGLPKKEIVNFRFVGASTFRPKDFENNRSLAQIGLAEDTKNGVKNLGKYWGRDLNPQNPDAEMMKELTKPTSTKKEVSIQKTVNSLNKKLNQQQ